MSAETISEVAARLGFVTVECPSCDPIIDPECSNCEGLGFVWSRLGATLSRTGLLRLAGSGRREP